MVLGLDGAADLSKHGGLHAVGDATVSAHAHELEDGDECQLGHGEQAEEGQHLLFNRSMALDLVHVVLEVGVEAIEILVEGGLQLVYQSPHPFLERLGLKRAGGLQADSSSFSAECSSRLRAASTALCSSHFLSLVGVADGATGLLDDGKVALERGELNGISPSLLLGSLPTRLALEVVLTGRSSGTSASGS